MTTTSLRPAVADDLPFVTACARAAYAPYVERIGREPAPMLADFAAHFADGDVFIIENDAPIGYSVHSIRDDILFVENIAIEPTMQGGGVGRIVFGKLNRFASEAGATRIDLYTNAKMTEALAFYDRIGFRVTDRRIEEGFDRIYLSKDV